MQVVAEGVETCEQLAFLQEQCCPEGQGYYFGRPVVAEEFAILLGRGRPAGAQYLQPQTWSSDWHGTAIFAACTGATPPPLARRARSSRSWRMRWRLLSLRRGVTAS